VSAPEFILYLGDLMTDLSSDKKGFYGETFYDVSYYQQTISGKELEGCHLERH